MQLHILELAWSLLSLSITTPFVLLATKNDAVYSFLCINLFSDTFHFLRPVLDPTPIQFKCWNYFIVMGKSHWKGLLWLLLPGGNDWSFWNWHRLLRELSFLDWNHGGEEASFLLSREFSPDVLVFKPYCSLQLRENSELVVNSSENFIAVLELSRRNMLLTISVNCAVSILTTIVYPFEFAVLYKYWKDCWINLHVFQNYSAVLYSSWQELLNEPLWVCIIRCILDGKVNRFS